VFLILVSLIFVTRSLVRPVRSLTDAMDASRGGLPESRAPVTSSDELGVLSERFNEMIEGLRERDFIRQTFGRYVPDKIAALLLANKGVVQPRLTTATILYLDIENFTGISESRSPDSVLELLNAFFGAAIDAIQGTGGVVNQFHGDAMLVTYNVPVADPDHADNALAAAIAIQKAVTEKTFAGTRLRVRIGINTGRVVAGAVGGEERLSYTVYGDAVNLAARLEALNKDLGSRVLISASTVGALRGSYPLSPMGQVTVRGKRRPVMLYALDTSTFGANAAAPSGPPVPHITH
jgi:class 3 adenylate cyclase